MVTKKQNNNIATVLDVVLVSDFEEVSNQDTDGDVIEWGKLCVLYFKNIYVAKSV